MEGMWNLSVQTVKWKKGAKKDNNVKETEEEVKEKETWENWNLVS